MEDFKIQKIGPNYYVLEFKTIDFDGIRDKDWAVVSPAHNTKEEAEDYLALIGGKR